MTLDVGDRVGTGRPIADTGLLAFPILNLAFGTVTDTGGGVLPVIIWDTGIVNTVDVGLDKLIPGAEVFSVVRLAASQSPEYRGIVIGHYQRQVQGVDDVTGPYYLVQMLSGFGFYEALVSDCEVVPNE